MDRPQPRDPDRYAIPNLRNACRVLRLLAEEGGGLPLAAIVRRLAIPRTTALRILSTLSGEGLLDRRGKHYVLGTGLIRLGTRALESTDVRTVAIPVLYDLSQATQETAHLAVPSADQSLLLEVCDSPHPVRVASRPGTLADIHCSATGKVFLAFHVSDLAAFLAGRELARRTPNTMTAYAELAAEVERIRARGYAVDEEEHSRGVRCLAAPICNAFGTVVAAIGITASTSTFPRRRTKAVASEVTAAAARVSALLGGVEAGPR
ncbi:MAG: IclR family transcriptional regulator [Planctomycetota bacterium]